MNTKSNASVEMSGETIVLGTKRELPVLALTIGPDYLSKLSQEVGEWANANFDSKDPLDPFLGMVEELGERAKFERINPFLQIVAKMHHHVLKAKQGIRGTGEEHRANYNDLLYELRDLVVDGDLEWHNRGEMFFEKNMEEIVLNKKTGLPMTEKEIAAEINDSRGDFLIYLSDDSYRNNVDLGEIAAKTWNKVRLRDWRLNPTDAAEKAGD